MQKITEINFFHGVIASLCAVFEKQDSHLTWLKPPSDTNCKTKFKRIINCSLPDCGTLQFFAADHGDQLLYFSHCRTMCRCRDNRNLLNRCRRYLRAWFWKFAALISRMSLILISSPLVCTRSIRTAGPSYSMQRNTENNFSVGVIAELCTVFEKED